MKTTASILYLFFILYIYILYQFINKEKCDFYIVLRLLLIVFGVMIVVLYQKKIDQLNWFNCKDVFSQVYFLDYHKTSIKKLKIIVNKRLEPKLE